MNNIKTFGLISICLLWFCCTNKEVQTTTLDKSDVKRISERIELTLVGEDVIFSHNKFNQEGITGIIRTKSIYNDNGEAFEFYRGGTEGLIPHSNTGRKGYLPFVDIEDQNSSIQLNKAENYIIYTNSELKIDIIKDFKVFSKSKMIISEADYTNVGKLNKGTGARIIVYLYE